MIADPDQRDASFLRRSEWFRASTPTAKSEKVAALLKSMKTWE